MAETLKQEILEEIAKIPEIDTNENYEFYLNLSELIGDYADALRRAYNEERIDSFEQTVVGIFQTAKTLDYKTGKLVPLDYEGVWYDMDPVVDALKCDTYHDDEVDADLTGFKIEKGKLYFHAVSYHLDDWVQLEAWSTRKIDEILKKTISAAKECTKYTSIPDNAFENNDGLTEIHIPDSVTKIGNCAFAGCSGLKEIQIPDSVTKIGEGAFYECSELTEIHIPDSVTKIGADAFRECSGLSEIHIPDGVTEIGYCTFYGCSGLSEIHIPDGVTKIGEGAFGGCSGLTEIHIPDSVTQIGDGAFAGCSGLTEIHIPDSVTEIGERAFAVGSGLGIISVSSSNKKYDSRLDCNAIIETEASIIIAGCKSSTIPDGVTQIADGAFARCSGLTEIHIPNSVKGIGKRAFARCSGLTEIHIPDSVTKIGEYAFQGCSGLKTIVIPKGLDLSNVSFPDGVEIVER